MSSGSNIRLKRNRLEQLNWKLEFQMELWGLMQDQNQEYFLMKSLKDRNLLSGMGKENINIQ